MPDTPLALIRDTLAYLKDPLLPKQTLFATTKECALLQSKQTVRNRVPIQPQLPSDQSLCKPLPSPSKEFKQESKEKKITPIEQKNSSCPADFSAAESLSHPSKETQARLKEETVVESQPQIKKLLQRIAPAMKLTDQIPDDEKAKRISNAWKERIPDAEVVLFACDAETDTLDLLKALAKAIDQNLAKSKILMAEKFEREKRWDSFLETNPLRLIIATSRIDKFPALMRVHKALPASGRTPLLVLSPTSVYKSLEQKALLWKTLCQMLKK